MPHLIFIIFLFLLGSCVGSFLNVVVWRLPRNESIVSPPSHCPRCNTPLAWYDNIPVFGWIALGGKCRYCKQPISVKYPIFEALTGGLFVFYYVALFMWQMDPCVLDLLEPRQCWGIYFLIMFMLAGLLASSLIDAEHFIIPIEIPWLIAAIAIVVHAIIPSPLMTTPPIGAMAAGATIGLILSIVLLRLKILPQSFAEGGPLLEIEKQNLAEQGEQPPVEFTSWQVRMEIQKEMLFLMPPLIFGGAWMMMTWKLPAVANVWNSWMAHGWLSGMLGSLWGALVGAFIIWFIRIFGSIAFGREAMGLGDVHLMLGIGAVIGAAGAIFVFFIAPFIGLLFGLYKLLFKRGREVPYGPFLSLATAVVVLFYCRLLDHFGPPTLEILSILRQRFFGE